MQTFLLYRTDEAVITRSAHEGDKVSAHAGSESSRGNRIHSSNGSGCDKLSEDGDFAGVLRLLGFASFTQLNVCLATMCWKTLQEAVASSDIRGAETGSSRTDRPGGVGKFTQNRTVRPV
jgi:hypothetical protein